MELQKKSKSEALLEAEDPFKDLQEQLGKFAVYNSKFFQEGTTADNIFSVDDFLTSTESLMTDDPILCNALNEERSETRDDTDDVCNEPICPQSSDVRQALDVIQE